MVSKGKNRINRTPDNHITEVRVFIPVSFTKQDGWCNPNFSEMEIQALLHMNIQIKPDPLCFQSLRMLLRTTITKMHECGLSIC